MHEVQEPQLHVDEEQENHDGAAGAQEVLQSLPRSYSAQGNTLSERRGFMGTGCLQASSSNGRAAVSKTACWGFESLLACHFQLPGAGVLNGGVEQ